MSRQQVALIVELRQEIEKMQRLLNDMKRQNTELREAIVALMEPGMPRVLLARSGIMVMDDDWLKGRPEPVDNPS
jgi:hypothetical protein